MIDIAATSGSAPVVVDVVAALMNTTILERTFDNNSESTLSEISRSPLQIHRIDDPAVARLAPLVLDRDGAAEGSESMYLDDRFG